MNGFWFDYPTYRDGGRVKVNGNSVSWIQSASYDDSYEAFERYLFIAFSYSSTLSMWEESRPADIGDVQIGDVFLRGGSPGHVVMVADVCEDGQGRKAFLLAQSYMPAQQFHVLNNPLHREDPLVLRGRGLLSLCDAGVPIRRGQLPAHELPGRRRDGNALTGGIKWSRNPTARRISGQTKGEYTYAKKRT